jgi:hypothetical protein
MISNMLIKAIIDPPVALAFLLTALVIITMLLLSIRDKMHKTFTNWLPQVILGYFICLMVIVIWVICR